MKKVYITGSSGFIGQYVVSAFLAEGYQVYALVRPQTIIPFNYHKNLVVVTGDITDIKQLAKTMPPRCVIVHLAANPYHKTLSKTVNILGTKNLLRIAKEKRATKFIQISSQATKIARKGVYGLTKDAADNLVRASALPYTILKPSLVYGPSKRGLFTKLKASFAILPIIPIFGSGNTLLYPIHVADLSSIIFRVAAKKMLYDTYDVGTPQAITYNKLYQKLLEQQKLKKPVVHIPKFIGLMAAKVCAILPNPPLNEDNILGSTQDSHTNPKPLLARLQFSPRSFDQGLSDTFAEQSKTRVAIVGLGKMGILHASILSMFDNISIVALIDTNKNLYATIKSMGASGTFYPSFDEAIARKTIDAVYICTPTFTHEKLARLALKNYMHVFLEKPATLSSKETNLLIKAQKHSIVAVGYTLLYKRTFQHAKTLLEEGKLGPIQSYDAHFWHGEVLAAKKGWMYTKTLSGGGALMNPGPHLFALLYYYFGIPKKVTGTVKQLYSTDVDDQAHALLSYGSFTGSVNVSWSVPDKPISETKITVACQNGTLAVTDQTLTITQHGKTSLVTERDLPAPPFAVFNSNPVAHGEAYFLESKSFIDAISNKTPLVNNLAFAANTEAIIHTIYQKARYEKQ